MASQSRVCSVTQPDYVFHVGITSQNLQSSGRGGRGRIGTKFFSKWEESQPANKAVLKAHPGTCISASTPCSCTCTEPQNRLSWKGPWKASWSNPLRMNRVTYKHEQRAVVFWEATNTTELCQWQVQSKKNCMRLRTTAEQADICHFEEVERWFQSSLWKRGC